MTKLRTLSGLLILSTALTVGACKGKDKTVVGESAPVKALKTSDVSFSEINSLFDVDSRKVSNADAEKALAMLGLSDSNQKGLSWDKRSGEKGNYTFTNLTLQDDEGKAIIEEVKLSGVHMDGEFATFDKMVAQGLEAEGSDGTVRVESLAVARPSPAFAAAITKALSKLDEVKDLDDITLDIELDDDDIYFGALRFDAVEFEGSDINGSLDSLAWGEFDDSSEGLFVLEGLEMKGRSDDDIDVNVKLGAINATGLNMAHYRAMSDKQGGRRGGNPMNQIIGGVSPYTKTFDTVSFSDVDISMDGLHITTDGGQGKTTQKGDSLITRQVLQPLVIRFDGEPTERGLIEAKKSLTSLGYDELVITSAQTSELNAKSDTVTVSDSFLDLKDGFRLSYGYEASGVNAVREGVESAQRNGQTLNGRQMEKLTDNITVKSIDLALADKSIVDRGFKFAAEKQGSSPKVLRMQAKSMLMIMGLGVKTEAQGELIGELSRALGQFIDDGGTLKLQVAPAEPLTVNQLRKLETGDMGVEALGFSATVE